MTDEQKMLMSKLHTVGPWEVADTFVNNSENQTVIRQKKWGGRTIAVIGATKHLDEEDKANARLLAAATLLYNQTLLLEKILVYEIKKAEAAGDIEGANLKRLTLADCRYVIERATKGDYNDR